MKSIRLMSQLELAAYVQSHLRGEGIEVVLSGGAAVSLYSDNQYVSRDVDLVNVRMVKSRDLSRAMARIGFVPSGRHFVHPESAHIIEFPNGPLAVGEEAVQDTREVEFETGRKVVISPADCVKDRLCAYYFWGDRQGLKQAVMVAKQHHVNLGEIARWSKV